ncbi:MAG: hypothetical protein M0Z63_02360 [Actinomycetota bacterium]|nr:hypothetical protein [Actinomycetota bacterium]
MSAWMPSTKRPEAVSSTFSVTDTSATPRRRSSARMATWSSMFRARRSILCTTTASTSRVSAMRASMAFKAGRSAVRADSPRSTYSSTKSHEASRMWRVQASRWAGMEKPSSPSPFSACSRVDTRR